MKSRIKKICIVIAGGIVVLVTVFLIYVNDYYHAEALPASYIQNTQEMSYQDNISSYIFFFGSLQTPECPFWPDITYFVLFCQ